MNYLRREIRTRRILVKPSFQDFDRINVNHVTYEQFTRALTKLGLNLPAICFKILARKYMDKNNSREINYDQFLKDVDYEHLLKGTNFPGQNAQSGNGLGFTNAGPESGTQSGAPGKQTTPPFGVDLLPGERNGQEAGATGKSVQISLDESQRKQQFDEDSIPFDRAEQRDFSRAGLDKTENRKGFTGTSIANSNLKVGYV